MKTVPRETRVRLDLLRAAVIAENDVQNLVSPTTVADFDNRHIDDSLQLLDHIPIGTLMDIGTGAGFPGLVLACCRNDHTHLVEPRRRRAAFLTDIVAKLGLGNATTVWQSKVERLDLPPVAAITARAFAPLTAIFAAAERIATPETRWVLPKGRTAQSELDTTRTTWQGDFELVRSATDPDARIVLATNVHRRR